MTAAEILQAQAADLRAIAAGEVPASIAALIADRLDRLAVELDRLRYLAEIATPAVATGPTPPLVATVAGGDS